MERISSETLLNRLEEKVEKHLHEAIDVFQNLDAETLLRPAPNDGWSIAQCLEHLNRYGDYYLPEIGKKMDQHHNTPASPWFKSTWIGHHFTRMMDPATGKTKLPAFKSYKPQHALDAHGVVAKFILQQEKLLVLLRDARNTDLNRVRIPVSIARFISLKVGDVFQFLIAHNERHVLQAKRNLKGELLEGVRESMVDGR
jgi:hypothetical protein